MSEQQKERLRAPTSLSFAPANLTHAATTEKGSDRMKPVIVFEAEDGSRWSTETEAQERDEMQKVVSAVMARLPKTPDRSGVRVAVSRDDAMQAKADIVALCRGAFPREPVFQHPAEEIHPFSYAGRFLTEASGPAGKPLNRAWFWFMCYDTATGFLYEQPYYANNPDKWEPRSA